MFLRVAYVPVIHPVVAEPVCGWHTFFDLLLLSYFPPSFSCLSKEISVRSLVLLAMCVSVAVVWGVFRNEDRYRLEVRSLTNGCCCSSRSIASGRLGSVVWKWLGGVFLKWGMAARRECCCFQEDTVLFNS